MPSPPSKLTTLLSELAESGVEFVLVGGLAAVSQGAPITTHDVDIVHRRTPGNVDALHRWLVANNARYRGRPGGEPLAPTVEALQGTGHHLLVTDLGPIDVLGNIDDGKDYESLRPKTIELSLSGIPVLVLTLEAIVEAKRRSTHPKDQQALPILEETLTRGSS